jgi:hypothetical protein
MAIEAVGRLVNVSGLALYPVFIFVAAACAAWAWWRSD